MTRSVLRVVVVAGLVLAFAQPGQAVTPPASGAVALPAGFDIRLPFTAGETCYVSSGYGPSGGSSLHDGTDNTSSANDYYALDFIMPQYGSNNGLGQPVLSVASGEVVRAGWATAGWANYGLRVIIRHDFNADGHVYHSVYAHLNAIYVSEGQLVGQGEHLGDLGDSCEGDTQNLSCPWFGAHLHWVLHQDSTIGGSGTGGSYGGHAVVPEFFDGYEDLTAGQTLTSSNNGQPPQPCQLIQPVETILEDDGPCFQRFGPTSYWHDESTGHGAHSVWTYTIDAATPDNWVRWNLHFAQSGSYELWAYVPGAWGQSVQAPYVVRHDGAESTVTRDQSSASDDWLSLGTFDFAAGADQWVSLADNTGEAYTGTNGTTIAFDALRIAPVGVPCECSTTDADQSQACGQCGTQTRSCDGCFWPDWSTVTCDEPASCDADAGVVTPDAVAGDPDASTPDPPNGSGGCSCRHSSPSPAPLWMLLVLVMLALRRRRLR